MAWSANTTSDTLTLTTSLATVQASSADMVITLNPRELAELQFDVNSAGTTDDVNWEVQSSPDSGTTWDNIPFMAGRIDVTSSSVDQIMTVNVMGVERFRVQASKTGSTDTITFVVRYRKDGVSA